MESSGSPRSHELPVPLGVPHFSSGRSGSGVVWPSPRSLMTFVPSPARASRVFPSRPPSSAEAVERRPSWPLPLLQSARESAGTASRWFLLSWDSSVSLPPATLPRVHSRKPRLPSDQCCHTPVHVPPSWFRTTSTACSARELRVCCTPQPAKGSPRFARTASRATREWRGLTGRDPRDAVHTLRRVPLISSRTASLRPLPSCRYRPARRGSRPRPFSLPTAARRGVRRTPAVPCRGPPACPAPRGREPGFPMRRVGPASIATRSPSLRRASETLSRWEPTRDAPKSPGCRIPVRFGARCSEELH
jgi:hypothetical protein